MDEEVSQIAITKVKITKTSLVLIYTQIGCGGGRTGSYWVYFSGCKYERVMLDMLYLCKISEYGMLGVRVYALVKRGSHFSYG